MKKNLSNVLLILGMVLAIIAVMLAFTAKDNEPRLMQNPTDALKRADEMMTKICAGDYPGASGLMYGQPSLGAAPEGGSLAVELLWTAYLDSLEYDISEKCYVVETGVAVDVTVRMLDIPAVIRSMEWFAQDLLGKRVAAAEDMSEIYDEDNNFRQEVMDKILRDAAVQALADNPAHKEQVITLHLIHDQGKWWVMPDAGLQNILSGAF